MNVPIVIAVVALFTLFAGVLAFASWDEMKHRNRLSPRRMTMREHEYTAQGYAARARECAVLANQARDEMIQMELLKLRQTFLKIARRLQGPHQA